VIRRCWLVVALSMAAVAGAEPAHAHPAKGDARLSKIGPAPDFALTDQGGRRLALADLRGKVVAVTFIYASCADTCPLLATKLIDVQRRLGPGPGARTHFVAITVDPERDTPEVLRQYGAAHGARPGGWAFLTGTPEEIRDVSQRYGIYVKRNPGGDVDHTFLTSLIDGDGVLRVQYLGVRFDPGELLRDLRSLLREGSR
jgi:protein SCO1